MKRKAFVRELRQFYGDNFILTPSAASSLSDQNIIESYLSCHRCRDLIMSYEEACTLIAQAKSSDEVFAAFDSHDDDMHPFELRISDDLREELPDTDLEELGEHLGPLIIAEMLKEGKGDFEHASAGVSTCLNKDTGERVIIHYGWSCMSGEEPVLILMTKREHEEFCAKMKEIFRDESSSFPGPVIGEA